MLGVLGAKGFSSLMLLALDDAGDHLCPPMRGAYLWVKLTQKKIDPEDEERKGQMLMALHLALLKSAFPYSAHSLESIHTVWFKFV